MKKDPNLFLAHILESITAIEKFVTGTSRNEFMRSVKTQDAVIRRLEIIGEAAKNLPVSFRKKYSDVPWKEMAGLRDKLIHGYFRVDLDLAWDVVTKELPDLKRKIRSIVDSIAHHNQ